MDGYTKEELCLIWLDSFEGLEYKHKQTLINLSNSIDATSILEKGKDYILTSLNANVYSTLKNSLNVEYMQYVLDNLRKNNVVAITIKSSKYPQSLVESKVPPLVLYTVGNQELLEEQNIFAIVGSRKSLPQSLSIASDYAKTLIKAGFTLVTGIAQGVDQRVVETALSQDAKIICVMAGGILNVYPKSNTNLLEKVAKSKNGLVIAEHPPQVTALPYMFPLRNRIFSGLAKGVLIVSAGKKSGTLWTANYAVEYGKDVFAIPYSVGVSSGEGCNSLIKQGANLTDSPQDILDYYQIEIKQTNENIITEEEKRVIKILSNGKMHVEKISATLGKKTFEIMPTISIMEIKGIICKSGNICQLTRTYSEE